MANKLALRMLELARSQHSHGKYFSIENPFSSLIWELKQYSKLAKEDGIRMVRVHQCMAGSSHRKETGILTNAPWLKDLLCDAEVRPHHHVPLVGLVEDFRGDGGQVFYTELAAEYPAGLCDAWATGWRSFLRGFREGQVFPGVSPEESVGLTAGVPFPGASPEEPLGLTAVVPFPGASPEDTALALTGAQANAPKVPAGGGSGTALALTDAQANASKVPTGVGRLTAMATGVPGYASQVPSSYVKGRRPITKFSGPPTSYFV